MSGITLDKAKAEERGFQFDRRFMLVDTNGKFLTQRSIPELALFRVSLSDNFVTVEYNDQELLIPLENKSIQKMKVNLWKSNFKATSMPVVFNEFFSDNLKNDVRLVAMKYEDRRQRYVRKVSGKIEVSFADGYPYLITGTASLEDLNSKMDTKIPMNRFRPNIVLNTKIPFIEDTLTTFSLGNATFKMINPCKRCKVITINQDTAFSYPEPLEALAKHRKVPGGVIFGMNAICISPGEVYSNSQLYSNEK